MGIQLLIDGILKRTALVPIHCTFRQGTCKTVFNTHQHLFSITASKASYCKERTGGCEEERGLEREAEKKVDGYRRAISQEFNISPSSYCSIIKRE